jgi:hypothetical protein
MKLLKINQIEHQTSYDIEVEDTHCFFANGILVHNSNSSFSINQEGEYWAGSRTQIVTPLSDNAGFASFVESKREVFKSLAATIPFNGYDIITIFGEWCGGNIQKGVAINGLPKMFVIFDIKRSYFSDNIDGVATQSLKGPNLFSTEEEIKTLRSPENLIFNIYDYQTFEVEVDFDNPGLTQNKLIELTSEVEKECPVGKAFGNIGVGEGIVYKITTVDIYKMGNVFTSGKTVLSDKLSQFLSKYIENDGYYSIQLV